MDRSNANGKSCCKYTKKKKTTSGSNAFFLKKNFRKKQFMHTKTISAAL